jgi:hypothetical protein
MCLCVCRCFCFFVQGVSVSVFLLPERSSLYCADFSSQKVRNCRLRCCLQIRISVSTPYFKWTIYLSFGQMCFSFWTRCSDSTKGHDLEIIFSVFLFSYFCLFVLPSKQFLSLFSFFLLIHFICLLLSNSSYYSSSLCSPFHPPSLPPCSSLFYLSIYFLNHFKLPIFSCPLLSLLFFVSVLYFILPLLWISQACPVKCYSKLYDK